MRSISIAVLLLLITAFASSSSHADTVRNGHSAMYQKAVQATSLLSSSTTFAQSSYNDSQSSGGSTRVRTRGIGRLIGLVVVVLLAAGRFIFRMFTGGGDN